MTETIFQFLCTYIHSRNVSPTLQEIADGCYVGVTTVVYHLDKLEKRGRISRDSNKHRSIRLLDTCKPINDAVD
jgi:DNA-binding MarR family transcriptional regulator